MQNWVAWKQRKVTNSVNVAKKDQRISQKQVKKKCIDTE